MSNQTECPKCGRQWDRLTEQAVSIELFAECVDCRFGLNGAGTDHELVLLRNKAAEAGVYDAAQNVPKVDAPLSEFAEQWIQQHRFPRNGNDRPEHQSFVIREADLRALLSEYTLCSKEPVGYFDKYDFEDMRKAGMTDMSMVVAAAPLGYLCCPLYAPADTGKGG